MFMGVEPAGLAMGVSQGNLTAMDNHLRLTPHNGAQTTIKTGLELAGHQRIMSASLGQDAEVEGEESKVEDSWDEGEDGQPGETVSQQLPVRPVLSWQQSPVILDQQIHTQEACVDANVFHTENIEVQPELFIAQLS